MRHAVPTQLVGSGLGWAPVPHQVRTMLHRCFVTRLNGAITLLVCAGGGLGAYYLVRFAIFDAVFVASNPESCHVAKGACWATVSEHARLIFLGLYPREDQWRAVCSILLTCACACAAFLPVLHRAIRLVTLSVICWAGVKMLLGGAMLGLAIVPVEQWGGLPLTIYVFLSTIIVGFPAALVLSVVRTSKLKLIRASASLLVEAVRAVPLLTILFVAAVVVPIMVPNALTPAKTSRIIFALSLFYACYQSEVIRGGMRGVSQSEIEAAMALGLKSWQIQLLIVLPQAVRFTIPATVNLLIVAFKDTSLIVVVGLFDFLAAANLSISSDAWAPFFGEVYIVVACAYLLFTLSLSALGRIAELHLRVIR
jgi:general L-amino acid transport system permease protein